MTSISSMRNHPKPGIIVVMVQTMHAHALASCNSLRYCARCFFLRVWDNIKKYKSHQITPLKRWAIHQFPNIGTYNVIVFGHQSPGVVSHVPWLQISSEEVSDVQIISKHKQANESKGTNAKSQPLLGFDFPQHRLMPENPNFPALARDQAVVCRFLGELLDDDE